MEKDSAIDKSFWISDFDEQTTDDLDVDFSAYEEPGAGDKDIKDFLKIRQEQRWGLGSYQEKYFGFLKIVYFFMTISRLNQWVSQISFQIEKNKRISLKNSWRSLAWESVD